MNNIYPLPSRQSAAVVVLRLACWVALSAELPAALFGCQASSPRAAAAPHLSPADTPSSMDDSYDWHGLVIAPFGSTLKDVPATLHEVLLFRDEHGGSPDDLECFAGDAPFPRFLGRTSDEYLLCFKQNRLSRIQASVRLEPAEAAEVFAAACSLWLNTAAPIGDSCEGRDGAVQYSGRLGQDPDQPQMTLSITLDGAPAP